MQIKTRGKVQFNQVKDLSIDGDVVEISGEQDLLVTPLTATSNLLSSPGEATANPENCTYRLMSIDEILDVTDPKHPLNMTTSFSVDKDEFKESLAQFSPQSDGSPVKNPSIFADNPDFPDSHLGWTFSGKPDVEGHYWVIPKSDPTDCDVLFYDSRKEKWRCGRNDVPSTLKKNQVLAWRPIIKPQVPEGIIDEQPTHVP